MQSAEGSPDYAQVWHSDVHGTTPGALYTLFLTEEGELQINEMNTPVDGGIPTVKKTWWHTNTAKTGIILFSSLSYFIELLLLGVKPYKLVLYEFGLVLQDVKKVYEWV